MILTSRPFTVSAGKFIRSMVMWRLGRLWWLWLLPLTVASVMAYLSGDVRWIIVALMILLIVVPMIMSWAFFADGLTEEGVTYYFPRTVSVSSKEIIITYLPKKSTSHEESEANEPSVIKPPKAKIIPAGDIVATIDMGKSFRIRYGQTQRNILEIPINVWEGRDRKELMKIIDSWHKNC